MAVIGVGFDLVDIARAERLLAHHGERALGRLLTPDERAYVRRRPARAAHHVAARVAAKEAVYKALQTLEGAEAIGWQEIEVVRADRQRPVIALHGLARRITDEVPGFRIHLSLSHTDATAGAAAVAERE